MAGSRTVPTEPLGRTSAGLVQSRANIRAYETTKRTIGAMQGDYPVTTARGGGAVFPCLVSPVSGSPGGVSEDPSWGYDVYMMDGTTILFQDLIPENGRIERSYMESAQPKGTHPPPSPELSFALYWFDINNLPHLYVMGERIGTSPCECDV